MKKSNFKWLLPEEIELPQEFIQQLQEEKIPVFLGEILWQRGIHTKEQIKSFFNPSLEQLYDPFLLFDMDKAVNRIHQALEKNEKILVYGDYDADGITSATLMKETLELLGGQVDYYLPNRFNDGYGPNKDVYAEKIAGGTQLIVTVDNGVSGHEAIGYANSQGVDVIVTDHHELAQELPEAYAIIHPRHPAGHYPFRELAGVGVAFKFACALLEEIPGEFLDLVAIGTICDMVSLTDENRTLVMFGLEALKQTDRLGLLELLKVSQSAPEDIDESTVGFMIGPRLNALGRLEDPNDGVELLSTFDEEKAIRLAQKLDAINVKRKSLTEKITQEAVQQIDYSKKIQIISSDHWHEGVLGIVAGNIAKKIGQPTLILTQKENGIFKGSGRSVDSIDLFHLLNQSRDLLMSFGGHHSACGLSIKAEYLTEFINKTNELLVSDQIQPENYLKIDGNLAIEEININNIKTMHKLAPFGMDNALPNILFKNCSIMNARTVGADNKHLKLSVKDDSQAMIDGIAFGFGDQHNEFQNDGIDIVATLSINEWNHKSLPQFVLQDFSVQGLQIFDYRTKQARQKLKLDSATLLLCFSSKAQKKWAEKIDFPILVFQNQKDFSQQLAHTSYDQLLLLDCPLELETVKSVVSETQVSRVFLLCKTFDDAYLDGAGSREQYARLFRFIAQEKKIDVRYKLSQVAKYLKLPEKLLFFMIQVFLELEFVTIKDGIMQKVIDPENHSLTESKCYQQRLKKIKTEEFLLLSDLPTIKNWLSIDGTSENVPINQEESK